MIVEQSIIDKIEIVGEFKTIQIRHANQVLKDGVVIAQTYSRECVQPGQTHPDLTVQKIIETLHTKEIIDAFKARP